MGKAFDLDLFVLVLAEAGTIERLGLPFSQFSVSIARRLERLRKSERYCVEDSQKVYNSDARSMITLG